MVQTAVIASRRSPSLRSILLEWRDLARYRALIAELLRRDLRERYAGSVGGALWNVVHPLIMIGVYIVVFSTILKSRIPNLDSPYAVYLCAGLVPWLLFQETVSRCANCFVGYGNLLKKTAFPKTVLPLTVSLSSLSTFFVMFSVYLAYLGYVAVFAKSAVSLSTGQVGAALALALLQQVFAFGLGLGLGTLNVFFRDTAQTVSVVLQVLFWASPIVWTTHLFADSPVLLKALKINPLYPFMNLYHWIFIRGAEPLSPWAFRGAMIWTAAALLFGVFLYRRLRDEIADQL